MKSCKFQIGDRVRWKNPPSYFGIVVGPEVRPGTKIEVSIKWDHWSKPTYVYKERLLLLQSGMDKLNEIL